MHGSGLSIVCTIAAIVVVAAGPVFSATYYVSNTGDDGQDGLSTSTAWQTINSVTAQGGDDHTFLFNRGDVFRGEIIANGTRISYGAYGTGDRPIIRGSVHITNWSWDAGRSCYVADETNSLKHLFVNGELMRIARYPNTNAPDLGWLRTDSGSSKATFYDAALDAYDKPDNYWSGATCRIRSYSWLFEKRTVVSSTSNGTITLDSDLTDTGGSTISPGWGYYLDGVLDELDAENEWYHDSVSNRVYLSPPGGVDPDTLLVEGMCIDHGIFMDWDKTNMVIEDLAFEHQADEGVQTVYSFGVTIRNCRFKHCYESGVQIAYACQDVVIENNLFEDMLNHAIEQIPADARGPGTTIIQSNTILRTALVAGYGGDGSQESSAIQFIGTGLTVRRNYIEDVGYVGIVLSGGNHLCEENTIRRAQLLLDDGGTIDINSGTNIVRRNLIFDTLGNRDISNGEDNTGWVHGQMGFSIFTQPNDNANIIEENTLINNTGGILIDTTKDTRMRSNLVYNTTSAYLSQHLSLLASSPAGVNDQITDNIFYSLSASQDFYDASTNYGGMIDRNYYCNPYGDVIMRQMWTDYTLTEWRAMYPAWDALSVTSLVRFPADAVTGTPSEDSKVFVNTNTLAADFDLGGNVYEDLDGNMVHGSITLDPFRSTILVLTCLNGTDNDEDGMEDCWEFIHFLSTDAPNGGATNDADGDGMINLYEFLGGCIPTDSNSLLDIISITDTSSPSMLVTWSSASNKSYLIESVSNLYDTWSFVAGGITASPPQNVWTAPLDNAFGTYRVRLE